MPIRPIIETDIPGGSTAFLGGRFHTLVVIALGVMWILDGLEVTLAGSLAGALKDSLSLQISNTDIGFVSSAYLAGATFGAIFFGWLTDGRVAETLGCGRGHKIAQCLRGKYDDAAPFQLEPLPALPVL